jgi:hypothetical protein
MVENLVTKSVGPSAPIRSEQTNAVSENWKKSFFHKVDEIRVWPSKDLVLG